MAVRSLVLGRLKPSQPTDPTPLSGLAPREVWPAGSALDDVVHRGNLRLAGIGPERPHDRQQRFPEGLERFLGIPDVEHLNLAVGLEGDVIEPTGRGTSAGRFQLADRFVVQRRCKRAGCEVETESHLLLSFLRFSGPRLSLS